MKNGVMNKYNTLTVILPRFFLAEAGVEEKQTGGHHLPFFFFFFQYVYFSFYFFSIDLFPWGPPWEVSRPGLLSVDR